MFLLRSIWLRGMRWYLYTMLRWRKSTYRRWKLKYYRGAVTAGYIIDIYSWQAWNVKPFMFVQIGIVEVRFFWILDRNEEISTPQIHMEWFSDAVAVTGINSRRVDRERSETRHRQAAGKIGCAGHHRNDCWSIPPSNPSPRRRKLRKQHSLSWFSFFYFSHF